LKAYIFNVEYRLSPEHKHPDALNDCYRATYYIIKLAEKLEIDKNKICISGYGTGGNLAAALSVYLTENEINLNIKALILFSPLINIPFLTKTHN